MNVDEKVRSILVSYFEVTVEQLPDAAKLIHDAGLDSLDMVELLMRLEEEFGIEISDDEWEALFFDKDDATVYELIQLIEKKTTKLQ